MIQIRDVIACPVCGQPLGIQIEEPDSVISEKCPLCRVEWEWLPLDQVLTVYSEDGDELELTFERTIPSL